MKAWGLTVRDHGGFGEVLFSYDGDYIETKLFNVHALAIAKALFSTPKLGLSSEEYHKLAGMLTRCNFDRTAIRKTVTIAKKVISGKRDFYNSHHSLSDKKAIARRCAQCIREYGDFSSEVLKSFERICETMSIPADTKDSLIEGIIAENRVKTFEEVTTDLNSLIGLNEVKTEISGLYNLFKLSRERDAEGLKSPKPSCHLVFTGNPGTGKTTVARICAVMFHELGYLTSGHTIQAQVTDLVGMYVGETGLKTEALIQKAIGGVLFIDEAYGLCNRVGSKSNTGAESVEILLQGMENHRDNLIVIVAGYEKEINKFISSNPGLESRFKTFIDFPDYKPSELCEIFKGFCNEFDLKYNSGFTHKLEEIMTSEYEKRKSNFGNARFVRNVFESCFQAMSNRLASLKEECQRDVSSLEVEDLSSIFNQ
jgi:stage V sporulation protein K